MAKFRTSGNWTSETVTNSTLIDNIVVTTLDCDDNNGVSVIEIWDSDDNLLSTFNDGIWTATTTTLRAADFDSGFTGTNVDYYIIVYPIGDGTKSATITDITINYASAEDDEMDINTGINIWGSGNLSLSRDAKFGSIC